jgi:hypothetical protein
VAGLKASYLAIHPVTRGIYGLVLAHDVTDRVLDEIVTAGRGVLPVIAEVEKIGLTWNEAMETWRRPRRRDVVLLLVRRLVAIAIIAALTLLGVVFYDEPGLSEVARALVIGGAGLAITAGLAMIFRDLKRGSRLSIVGGALLVALTAGQVSGVLSLPPKTLGVLVWGCSWWPSPRPGWNRAEHCGCTRRRCAGSTTPARARSGTSTRGTSRWRCSQRGPSRTSTTFSLPAR